MAVTDMTRDAGGAYYVGTVAAGQTGPWVRVPRGSRYEPLTVVGSPAGGAGFRVEYTISTLDDLDAETARPVPWDPGDQSAAKGAVIDARVTAVRLVNTGGGDVTWEART